MRHLKGLGSGVGLALLLSLAALGAEPVRFGVGMRDVPGRPGGDVGIIAPGSPAERAGIRVGDFIIQVGAARMENSSAVVRAIAAHAPGDTVALTVVRQGQTLTLNAVLAAPYRAAAPPATPASVPAEKVQPLQPLHVGAYATFEDPTEQAFTLEVPAGWAAVGSLTRRGALEISPFVRTLAPDHMTYLMIGEPTLLNYTPPNATTMRLGWREGSIHQNGLGGVSMLLRYVRGAQFARLYGEKALAGLCPGLRPQGTEERAELAAAIDKAFPAPYPAIATGGAASFTCRHGGHDMAVRVEAVTRADRNNVLLNVTFLHLPGRSDRADLQALQHQSGQVGR